MAQTYGYIRVSSRDQNEDRQLIAMRNFGVAEGKIYLDKKSGKDLYDQRTNDCCQNKSLTIRG